MMIADQQREQKEGFGRWGWFSIVEKLAKGDVTKFEDVYKTNYILCLNILSYWDERDALYERMKKEKEQKNKK